MVTILRDKTPTVSLYIRIVALSRHLLSIRALFLIVVYLPRDQRSLALIRISTRIDLRSTIYMHLDSASMGVLMT